MIFLSSLLTLHFKLSTFVYHLYHTEAFVLGNSPRGEGSNIISLFTRELGLLNATAQSVREERSKLRYDLQDFCYSDISLVRGKEFWRLTHAELIENIAHNESSETLLMFGRVFRLLRRLLAGEEKNEPLFIAIRDGLQFVKEKKDTGAIEGVEIVLVLRILHILGYLAPRNEFDTFLSHAGLWDDSVISKALLFRTLAISEINDSLKESQL